MTATVASTMHPIGDELLAKLDLLGDPIRALRLRKENICLLGFTDHRRLALELPHDEWALVGLNELYRYMPVERFDLWMELHPWADLDAEKPDEIPPPWPKHVDVLRQGFTGHEPMAKGFPLPVYLLKHRADTPMGTAYPKQAVEDDIGPWGEYKTSTPAWMMGLAIAAGFQKIHVYGVDMATDTEYANQRPCCEFLLGVAVGRGIEVHLPNESDLLHSFGQYAWGGGDLITRRLIDREKWLEEQRKQYVQQHVQLEAAIKSKRAELEEVYRVEKSKCEGSIHEILGQLAGVRYMKRSWAVSVASDNKGPHPDRTADPQTGITEANVLAVSQSEK